MAGTECGVKLLTRLLSKKRPAIVNLLPEIFSADSPKPGEILEISGESSSGKTICAMELIARTIIPVEYGGKFISLIQYKFSSFFYSFE